MTLHRVSRLRGLAVLMAFAIGTAACSEDPLDDTDLIANLESFERAVEDQPHDTVMNLLRKQAAEFKGRRVSVSSAVVASTYVRENTSNIYFGTTYDPADHLFLSEIDPALHESLANHRLWVSVVKTYPTRQISYELPVGPPTFEGLIRGQEVDFSCEIAALIRGKSVYCSPDRIEIATGR